MDSPALALTVAPRFTRSVHLRRDSVIDEGLHGYQVTPLVIQVLERILAGLAPDTTERAFSIVGPYGSGKSAFGVFLANYLQAAPGARRALVRKHAVVETSETLPHEAVALLPVTISGNNSALRPAILAALRESLTDNQRLLRTGVNVSDLLESADANDPQSVADAIARVAKAVARSGVYSGLALIVDELGQHLTYAAQQGDERDLFVLQTIAEMAARSGDAPCLVVTILHQAFDRYTLTAGLTRRTEWAKVQGRFIELPFQEPATQMIRMVARALCPDDRHISRRQRAWGDDLAAVTDTLGLRPTDLLAHEWPRIVARAFPLHPTVLVALPLLFRQLAQNERSLFAFLASYEPWGLQDFAQQERRGGPEPYPLYRLPQLFRYVETNLGASLFGSARGQRWAELVEAQGLVVDASETTRDVLTTIGTIGALGQSRGLCADRQQIAFALRDDPDDQEILIGINLLLERRRIVYRPYRRSYVIWEGSDLDVDDLLQRTHAELAGRIPLVDLLRQHAQLQPLVARQFSYRTGAVRQFAPRIVDVTALPESYVAPTADGELLYVVAADEEGLATAQAWATQAARGDETLRIMVVPRRVADLRDLLLDVAALQQILVQEPVLEHDRAARREVAARLTEAQHALRGLIEQAYGVGQSRWFWRGHEQTVTSARRIDALLSEACITALPDTPHVWNELIVRRQLSSAAAKARRNLIEAMLDQGHEANLGLTGYPPERAIYESLFAASGLHRSEADGAWYFGAPPADDPAHMLPTWEAIQQFLESSERAPRPVVDLYALLEGPPYGVKAGMLPLLLMAAYLANAGEIALYEHRNYVPVPDIASFERMLRQPGYFAVRRSRISGTRLQVFEHLARTLIPPALERAGQPAILDAVTPLLKLAHGLPAYSKATRQVSTTAQAIRVALLTARAPDELLFAALPQACGLPPFESDAAQEHIRPFFDTLRTGLTELQQAYATLVSQLIVQVRIALSAEAMDPNALRAELAERYRRISHATNDTQVRALGVRLESGGSGTGWIESVAALVGRKPPETWTDADAENFKLQIAELGRRFQIAEQIAVVAGQLPANAPVRRIGLADAQGERGAVIPEVIETIDTIALRNHLVTTLGQYASVSKMQRMAIITDLLQVLLDDPVE